MVKAGNIACVLGSVIMAVGIMSCSKEDLGSSKHPIGFHCAGTGTKAFVDTDNIKTEGNAFKVFAHIDFTESGTTSSFDRVVTYNSADGGKWEYEVEQYWLPGASYTFRAYYPADFPATISETAKDNYSIEGYKIASVPNNQKDILIASAERSTEETATLGTTVSFVMEHLLANINIKLKVSANLEAEVLGVGFTGVAKQADYINGNWANHSETTNIGNNMHLQLTSDTEKTVFEDGILAIPQAIASNSVFVLITTNITLPNGNIIPSKQFNLPLPTIEWKAGQKYTYTATIDADFDILFEEPEVETWDKEKMSGVVIIK